MTSKLERLLNLVAALRAASTPMSGAQLQASIEGYPEAKASARRAFERDKDDLRQMGIPIETVDIPGTDPPEVGYRIDQGTGAEATPQLAAEELAALRVAASLVPLTEIDSATPDSALWKLGGVVDDRAGPSNAPSVALPNDANLTPLFQAATELRLASFLYSGVEREVEPIRISFAKGHWYLTAFDRTRDAQRQYRVDRIEGSVQLGPAKAFVRPAIPTSIPHLRSWELGDGEPVHAELSVDADWVPFAMLQLGETSVVRHLDDGSAVFALDVRNTDGFRSYVLTYLDHAEVLSPAELRADIIAWLEQLAEAGR